MDQITGFLNDPLVAPIYALLVVTVLDFLLGVFRSIQAKVFDWNKLADVLNSTVLEKVIPLAALGVAAFFVTEPTAKTALQGAYIGGAGIALAAAVASFIQKITGSYTPTNSEMDKR
jgi:uncharacterized BrkB/YihY/UPF0761 family membrane protein